MKDLEIIKSYKHKQNVLSYLNQEINPCNGVEDISIIVNKKRLTKRKKHNVFKQTQQPTVAFCLSSLSKLKKQSSITRNSSMPEINKCTKPVRPRNRSGHAIQTQSKYKQRPFQSKFIVNVVSEHRFDKCLNPFNYPSQTKWKIYRCQLNAHEDTCCCSCNSDAMFEVMKSLYDCYKKKNCDNCDCILCGHLQRDERMLGEMRKSLAAIGLDTASAKERRDKIKKAEKALEGKTPAEKEKMLRQMAKSRQPLPEGKTPSEKALIKRIRNELGLPPEPKTAADKARMRKAEAQGIITPLEGKTPAQKEKILRAQAALGIPLPEGRTPSEKALIQKIQAEAGIPIGIPSEKLRKARAAGLITPLEGKTPEQKEKILKGLAMHGLPLPEGKTPSEKKLIDKIRADLGLPPEPKTKAMKEKYAKAANAGLLVPLEGKSPKEKERILQGLADFGIPLPEGRTPSEKALVAKVRARKGSLVEALSEKLRKAKTAGLLTPLKGKTPEQREKILRGLAMRGIPLPEGQTPSERKLIDKVRNDLGLPIEPKTKGIRDKHEQAAKAGLLQPLEGKTPAQKEKILRGLHDMGIPLPIGRTPSEKALIAKIMAGPPTADTLSEKRKKAKAAGLLTPLKGKTPEQREKILRALAMQGIPLPEGQTPSEIKLIDKVRNDLGLPIEPKTKGIRDKHEQAAKAGLLQPLEGKTPAQKEKILRGLHDMGIPLPIGRTPSEKALIAKIMAGPPTADTLSEKRKKAKAAGLLTPLKGKTPEQREKILRALAMQGIPLPEGQTPSEIKLIDKVRNDLGLPIEPKTKGIRDKHEQAAKAGLLLPLEGKSPAEKEKILQGLHDMGIPLPIGRTPSEKALIAKIMAGPPPAKAADTLSQKLKKAKAAGLLTPLKGKTPEQREKILRALAMQGIPLPEGQTPSERKLIDKVRNDLGLPIEPKTKGIRDKHEKAAKAGLLQPLEGKTPAQKEKILQGLHDLGIPLPVGRTPSEKALIAKIMAGPPPAKAADTFSEKLKKAKAAGLLTTLRGKTPEQREKILRALGMQGIPLPEGRTPSEINLINKVRYDIGLPIEPKTKTIRNKHEQAALDGLLWPMEGKTPTQKEKILRGLHDMGIPLPVGRTPSEKALITKITGVPEEERRKTRIGPPALPPMERRKLDEKTAKVVKEGKGPSDECICSLLTPESEREAIPIPKAITKSDRVRDARAAGYLTPLEGKTPEQKEKILKGLAKHGLPLPEGKTASEKKLIDKVRAELGLPPEPRTPSIKEKYAKAQAAGLITPLVGKSLAQKEKILRAQAAMGLPLPEGRTPSEKALIAKIKGEPPPSITTDKIRKAKAAGLFTPLAGKSPEQREKILKGLAKAGLPLPKGKTPSEKAIISKVKKELGIPDRTPSEKLRRAKAAGLLTPLEGKTPAQIEKILRGRAAAGLPLPIGRSPSERVLIQKIKDDTGYVTPSPSERYRKAKAAGLITPLKGKTPSMKEKIIKDMIAAGVPIPEGETPSEKALISKLIAGPPPVKKSYSEKMKLAKAAGLLTPLKGKTPEQKENIVRGLVKVGLPLPEPKTASEKDLIDRIRNEAGLPPEPKTPSLKEKYRRAQLAGFITPLEGKTPAEKEKILQRLHDAGIPLPEGRTPSEKSIIKRLKGGMPARKTASERLKAAKAAGLLTPLEGKTPAQKEKILRGLAKTGVPLPEGKTPSEKDLINKIRQEMGLPPEPKTPSLRERMQRAQAAGIITPLEGKTPAQKKKILQALATAGIPLPEGRTPSEKSLIAKIKAETKPLRIPSEKIRKAKAAGLLTPLEGKTPEQKEKIMRGLAEHGLPLPEAKTASEKKLAAKIRKELGLPPAPKTPSMKERHERAAAAGVLVPLEGLSPAEKERILRAQADLGLPLPEGRTPSEKSLIAKIKSESKKPKTPSEKLRRAKAAGLLTPLEGKTPAEKERIMRGLAEHGLPLPEAKTASEKKLAAKIRKELGLPPEPKTPSMKERYDKAAAAGVLVPLEGLSPAEKEKVLRAQADLGLPLPEGRTASEKVLIAKIKAEQEPSKIPSEKLRKAKTAGFLTPLEGKTPAEKERILRGLAEIGIPLPKGKTPSEKSLIHKIRTELGIPPPVKTASEKSVIRKAKAAGLFTPITGKSPAEKERILRGLAEAGLPLPVGKTASEKDLIKKIRAEAGLPPEPTPSEKLGKIKRKAKKVGVTASKKQVTTCDRGCGCDKKKIRFKHSYVKIRVTSPDISSFCDCPDECIPGVKSGAFIDNEGIKVTVGRVVGIPSYSTEFDNQMVLDVVMSNVDHNNIFTDLINYKKTKYKRHSKHKVYTSKMEYTLNTSTSNVSCSTRPCSTESENIYLQSSTPPYEGRMSKSDRMMKSSGGLQLRGDTYRGSKIKSTTSSFDSIFVLKSETSLSLNTSESNSMASISVMSDMDSSISFNSTQYSGYQSTDDDLLSSSLEGSITSNNDDLIDQSASFRERHIKRNIEEASPRRDYEIFKMNETKLNFRKKEMGNRKKTVETDETDEPVVVCNHLPNKLDVSKIVDKIFAKKRFSGASSIFIVVPTSDDNDAEDSSHSLDSITSIQSSKTHITANSTNSVGPDPKLRTTSSTQRDVQVCGKGKRFYMREILSSNDTETMFHKKSLEVLRHIEMTKNKFCQIITTNEMGPVIENAGQVVGIDTTVDRPCCCCLKESSRTFVIQKRSSKDQCVANVISRQITPLFLKDRTSAWFRLPDMRTPSAVTSILPCDIPLCSGLSSCHIPSSHSRRYRRRRHQHTYDYPYPEPTCVPQYVHKHDHTYSESLPCACIPGNLELIADQRAHYPFIESMRHKGGTARKKGNRKCGYSDICSIRSLDGLNCECDDEINTTTNPKPKICPCHEHYLVSDSEPGPTSSTKSMGVVTDLKGSEILSLQRGKPTQEAKQSSSHSETKKTRFGVIKDKLSFRKSKVNPEKVTDPVVPIDLKQTDPHSQASLQDSRQPSLQANPEATQQPSQQASRQPSQQADRQPSQQASRQPSQQASRQPSLQESPEAKRQSSHQTYRKPSVQASPDANQQATRQPTHRASRKSKKSKVTNSTAKPTNEADCVCQDVEGPGISEQITSGSSTSQKPKKVVSLRDPRDHQPAEQPEQIPPVPPMLSEQPKRRRSKKRSKRVPERDCACYGNIPQVPEDQPAQKSPKDSASPKTSNKITKFFSNIGKSSSPKMDCSCNDETLKIQEGQKTQDSPKKPKSSKKPKTPKDTQSPKKTSKKGSQLFAGIRKSLSPKTDCSCNNEIPQILVNQKDPKKDKAICECHIKTAQAGQNVLENKPPACGCIDDNASNEEKVICKCKEPKTKKKSSKISDPKSQPDGQPLPEQQQAMSDTEPASQSQPMSDSDQAPQSQPMSDVEQTPQQQEIPVTEQAPQSQLGTDAEQVKQSQPMSDTQPLPQPEQASPQETLHPQQMFQPQQMQQPHQMPQAQHMPQPQQMPQVELQLPPEVVPEGYLYEGIGPSCGWIDTGETMKLRSELTVSTSGFKVRKKIKRQKPQVQKIKQQFQEPEPEVELNFEDAIRYFASMNPERFRDLMQDELDKLVEYEMKSKNAKWLKKQKEKEKKEKEKAKKKAEKEKAKKDKKGVQKNKEEPKLPQVTWNTATESTEELADMYPKGFKFTIGGDTPIPGVAGMVCFDMIQESFVSW